ncbi:hypothetical protein COF67_25325 [Bacillus toyonensis]|nr:hypothetical protein COF67_25325 [Bacillus toyonensis]
MLILLPISLLPKKPLKANWLNRSIKWISKIHMFSFMFSYWYFSNFSAGAPPFNTSKIIKR